MIKGGYILQPRIFDKSKASKMSPVTRELWFYLLRNVNHKPHNGLREGQKFFRFSDIQEDLSWHVGYRKMVYSKPQITKALRRLCEGNMTATAKATHGIIITICNYSEYQDPKNYEGNYEGSTKELRKNSTGHNIYKNGKELKNDKETTLPHKNAVGVKEFYLTKKKRKLSGKRLESFLLFWDSFDYKKDKASAADSWIDIPSLTESLVVKICKAAEVESKNRNKKKINGSTPIYAQGWISGKRWEDEITNIEGEGEWNF